MKTTSYGNMVEREYEEHLAGRMPGVIDLHSPYAQSDGYELGHRIGTMRGLLIGSVSGAIMMLVVRLLF